MHTQVSTQAGRHVHTPHMQAGMQAIERQATETYAKF